MKGRKLVEYPSQSNVAAAVPATQPLQAPAPTVAPMDSLPHNLGATLGLIPMLLKSWIKSQPYVDSKGKTVHPSFEITLPGTRTKLSYNSEIGTIAIHDEVMEVSWKPGDPVRSHLPNPTDPRIAASIIALLEETHDCQMSQMIPSLSMKSQLIKYSGEDAIKNKDKDRFFLKNINLFFSDATINMAPENLIPTLCLHSLAVKGMGDISRLMECLERAHLKHKAAKIPVGEHDAVKMNFGQGL